MKNGLLGGCSCFDLLIHLVQPFVRQGILINKVAHDDEQRGGNDGREEQYGILCYLRVVGQLGVIGVHGCADEGGEEHHHKDAQHQLQALVGLELLPHLAERDGLLGRRGDILLAAQEAEHQEDKADKSEYARHREPGARLGRQRGLLAGKVEAYHAHHQRGNPAGDGESGLEGHAGQRIHRGGRPVARAIFCLRDDLGHQGPHQGTDQQAHARHHLGRLNEGVVTGDIEELADDEEHGEAHQADGEERVVEPLLAQPLLQDRHRGQDDECRNRTDGHEGGLVPVDGHMYTHGESDGEARLNDNLTNIGADHSRGSEDEYFVVVAGHAGHDGSIGDVDHGINHAQHRVADRGINHLQGHGPSGGLRKHQQAGGNGKRNAAVEEIGAILAQPGVAVVDIAPHDGTPEAVDESDRENQSADEGRIDFQDRREINHQVAGYRLEDEVLCQVTGTEADALQPGEALEAARRGGGHES